MPYAEKGSHPHLTSKLMKEKMIDKLAKNIKKRVEQYEKEIYGAIGNNDYIIADVLAQEFVSMVGDDVDLFESLMILEERVCQKLTMNT